MRIFGDIVDGVKEIERDLWEMGHKVHTKTVQDQIGLDKTKSREIVGYNFTLLDGSNWHNSFEALGIKDFEACRNYVREEIRDRTNPPYGLGLNPGFAWKQRRELWVQFLHEGKFSYTYSQRLRSDFNCDQLQLLDDLHNFDGESRQLILQIYDQWAEKGRRGGIQRVPCTMYYQFLDRAGYLYLIHNMRSCDLYKHFPIDLALTWLTCVGQAELWKKIPRVIMQIGSLHAFEEDMEKRGIF